MPSRNGDGGLVATSDNGNEGAAVIFLVLGNQILCVRRQFESRGFERPIPLAAMPSHQTSNLTTHAARYD